MFLQPVTVALSVLGCAVAKGPARPHRDSPAAGGFETLLTAVAAAGLPQTLKGEGALSLVAPTDAACAALPGGRVAKLLTPESKKQLIRILTQHLLPRKVMSSQLCEDLKAKAAEGAERATTLQGARNSRARRF